MFQRKISDSDLCLDNTEQEVRFNDAKFWKIEEEENRRYAIIQKAKSLYQLGGFRGLVVDFKATIVSELITSSITWISILIYTSIRVILRRNILSYDELPPINLTLLALGGIFLAIFLGLFTNQSLSQFCIQSRVSENIIDKINSICCWARPLFPNYELWRLIRYLNSAHIIGYCSASAYYDQFNTFEPLCRREKLLTDWEMERLLEVGLHNCKACFDEVIMWSVDVAHNVQIASKISDAQINPIKQGILDLSSLVRTMISIDEHPIPFIYSHMLQLTSLLYMALVSYTLSSNLFPSPEKSYLTEAIGGLFMLIFLFLIEGSLLIGRLLMTPYNGGLHDLTVLRHVRSALISSRRLASSAVMPSARDALEKELEQARTKKGRGYRYADMNSCRWHKSMKSIAAPSVDNSEAIDFHQV